MKLEFRALASAFSGVSLGDQQEKSLLWHCIGSGSLISKPHKPPALKSCAANFVGMGIKLHLAQYQQVQQRGLSVGID